MQGVTQLVPRESGIAIPRSAQAIAVELQKTQQNSKTVIEPELQDEFFREFENFAPELIQEAFRAWRRRSPFVPSISELHSQLQQFMPKEWGFGTRPQPRYQHARWDCETCSGLGWTPPGPDRRVRRCPCMEIQQQEKDPAIA